MDRRSAKKVMLNAQEILKMVNGHLFADQTRSWMQMLNQMNHREIVALENSNKIENMC
jgi:hypothetical protein